MKKEIIWLSVFFVLGIVCFIFDESIVLFFKGIENNILTGIFILFKPILIMFLFAGLIAFLLIKEDKKKWVVPLGIIVFLSVVISFGLKFIFMRERPFGLEEFLPIFSSIKDYSFPSSHSVFIFSLLPLLKKEFRRFKYTWIILAVLIAISRLYFGVHYASDVILGAVMGYLIGFIVVKSWAKYYLR